jgi:hypothetical protein
MAQNDEDLLVRKSVSIRQSMWTEIEDYRKSERLGSEAEALRLVINAGLKALKDHKP